MPAVAFSHDAAKRIAAAVRKVERTPQNMAGDRSPATPTEPTCWAYLLSPDLSGLHWSWLKLVPASRLPNANEPFAPLEQDRPLFELATPTFFSENTAREANGNQSVPAGTVVELRFIGYDTGDEITQTPQPVYVFNYAPPPRDFGLVPLHDHRDNLNGGFAFATFHPGTSLPQQPWHL